MRIAAALVPFLDVEVTSNGLHAVTDRPWLELEFTQRIPSGRWILVTYRASYLDHLVRPLIRFETADGEEWDTMSAPLFGSASWIGRVPDKTKRVLISPVDRPGPFGFEIEVLRTVSRLGLLRRAFLKDRITSAMAIGTRLINARQETRQALKFARGGIGIVEYARWRLEHYRSFDISGLDAPRRPASQLPHVRFFLMKQEQPLTRDTPLLKSLIASAGHGWSICASCAGDVNENVRSDLGAQLVVGSESLIEDLADDDLVGCIGPFVGLPDYALSIIRETAAQRVGAECFYGDEDRLSAEGLPILPQLKPDWSPHFEAESSYLGLPVFWRVGKVRQMLLLTSAVFDTLDWRRLALANATPIKVQHIRRVLATVPVQLAAPTRINAVIAPSLTPFPGVSIIIPTKNQLSLLRKCLNGLCFQTKHPILEILIVDNGSDPATHAFYATLTEDPRIRIMNMPGRFNFSAMCNAAAQTAKGECLVFLNNDISIVDSSWLGPLVAQALRSDVGAVGALLLFPNGTIQHAGVVVGMGGYADHISHGAPGDYAGYLGRIGVRHEVSAVTGACIAVEAYKFNHVNGFDDECLPVELNDIDLCLRLSTAGWRSLMCPESILIHHQSATRGFALRPFQRYGLERAYFRNVWWTTIRDDPFFHPALSLFSSEPALDG